MNEPKVAPCGSWKSPITSEAIVSKAIAQAAVVWDGEDIYWLEGRPSEGGRNVLVKKTPDGNVFDVTPAPFNVRTRVHEYGGGAFLIVEGTVYFSNFSDCRIYRQTPGSRPEALTPENGKRYADLILDRQRNRLLGVCEDHSQVDRREPENTLVEIDLTSKEVRVLVRGDDFYSSPRLAPDGTRLVWLSWNHPQMPWDGTRLWQASLAADGALGEAELIAGGSEESVLEPKWSPDGKLYFACDRTGWWNLYRWQGNGAIEPLLEMEAEFAYPHWVFGLSNYSFASAAQIICTYTRQGRWYMARLDTETKLWQPIEVPYSEISSLQANIDRLVFIASSPNEPTAVVKMDSNAQTIEVIRRSIDLEIDPGYLSIPEAIAYPTENGKIAHAWYYPPQNKDYTPLPGELPPLLVKSHGGPTAAASVAFNLKIQYWTSRGFAYIDVNYGGSTGYGREYRRRLDGNWGIVDVDDCVNAAKHLVARKKVDGDRLAISGGSAGGYTTLAALTFRDTFKAGASYYGVSDLEILARDTHKFESRYLDSLLGPYPEAKAIYQERSPINFTERLSCPAIFLQGLEDKVVPPNQAEMMVEALKKKGLPVAYVAFANEQHGFRSAENIKKALESEFYFYSRVFGFQVPDAIEPPEIFNLK